MADKVYRGGVTITITINMQADISGAATLKLLVKKPDNTIVSWTGTRSGTDYITYNTVAGDLDQAGIYKICPKLTYATGQTIYGETVDLHIYEHFE